MLKHSLRMLSWWLYSSSRPPCSLCQQHQESCPCRWHSWWYVSLVESMCMSNTQILGAISWSWPCCVLAAISLLVSGMSFRWSVSCHVCGSSPCLPVSCSANRSSNPSGSSQPSSRHGLHNPSCWQWYLGHKSEQHRQQETLSHHHL